MLKINFWSKESGNLMNHGKGLTPEHIQYLKQLEEGDRLILWFNGAKQKPTDASYSLKKYKKREEEHKSG